MIRRTFSTFRHGGSDFAIHCRKIIVCDGCRILPSSNNNNGKVTRKHANTKQTLRNGIATSTQADNYILYKKALRLLCEDANHYNSTLPSSASTSLPSSSQPPIQPSPFTNTQVFELEERNGYGFAVRETLERCNITTPYVCVIQHDRTFMRPTPITQVVRAMIGIRKRRFEWEGDRCCDDDDKDTKKEQQQQQ